MRGVCEAVCEAVGEAVGVVPAVAAAAAAGAGAAALTKRTAEFGADRGSCVASGEVGAARVRLYGAIPLER